MINRTTKLRWRRRLRRSKRQVEGIGYQAEDHLERHLFRRMSRLPGVLRFTSAWILLLILLVGGIVVQTRNLDGYYLAPGPVAGGTYVEGILGSFTNANPIYATGSVDSSVARLVFSGLLKYNQQNQLVGDLAESLQADERGATYTVRLRPNLVWQDGQPLTSADVIYTFQTIQNPDAQSPLAASWQGITITATDARTVVFTLPSALSAFPNSLVTGIVPRHKLQNVPVAQLRSVNFNTAAPVGAGPFKWQAVQVLGLTPETREEQIALLPNELYHGDRAKLNKFIIRSFRSEDSLLESFKNQELTAAAGLTSVPSSLRDDSNVHEHDIPLQSEVMVFLKNSHPILSDVKVRQALTMATNTGNIIADLGYPVIAARQPILKSQIGYDKNLNQLPYNLPGAKQLLDSVGWVAGSKGIRFKNGQPLTFTLYAPNDNDYSVIAKNLQEDWKALGVDLKVSLESPSDLQPIVSVHGYDALVYGIEIGADPDVYAYWASSQADIRSPNRLNLSEYKSTAADAALSAGRTRSDPAIRSVKYKPFLEAWRNDAPAIGLYQPRFLYLTQGQVFGFDPTILNNGTGRYANVNNWMIREGKALR